MLLSLTNLFFLFSLGYGTKTPKTIAGKIVTILYAILGIPICLMAVAAAGDLIKHIIEKLLVFIELKCLKRDHVEKIHRKVLFAEIFSFVVELLLRAEVTHKLYGWTYMDAVYSWFITFSTIGFGDLVPHLTQDKGFSTSNVIGSMFFELFALGTLASITKTTVEMLEKRAKKKSKVYCNEIPSCCGKKGVRTEDIQLGEVSHGDEKIENSNDQNLEEKAVGT